MSRPAMSEAQRGPKNHNWKGGRIVTKGGYVMLKRPEHPRADGRGYVYEHVLVAEEMLGRPLLPNEIVHHGKLGKMVNTPENLTVCASEAEHALKHREVHFDWRKPGEPNPLVRCACGCGGEFPRYDRKGRPRRFLSGHNPGKALVLPLFQPA